MSKLQKLIQTILLAQSDKNISFQDIIKILSALGFESRIKGSHHIFYRTDIPEIINIQPDGSKAKPYQVKQVRDLIIKYRLYGEAT